MKFRRLSLYGLILSGAALEATFAQTYSISTYAGGGPPPTPAAGVDISIGTPLGIASDQLGNAYFASLNCVFKVDSVGVVNATQAQREAVFRAMVDPLSLPNC